MKDLEILPDFNIAAGASMFHKHILLVIAQRG